MPSFAPAARIPPGRPICGTPSLSRTAFVSRSGM
jgi:hypothetical protein